jgi:hypothetical protein
LEQKLVIDWTIIDGPAAASRFGDPVAQAPRSFNDSTSIGATINCGGSARQSAVHGRTPSH